MSKISNSFARFMYGRNGMDLMNVLILWIYIIIMVVDLFVKSYILAGVLLLLAILFLYRSMSKNLAKRRRENEWIYRLRDSIRKWWRLRKNKWRDRKTHVYKKCPKCKSVLRLKKRKGKHTCKCPNCGAEVKVNVHFGGKE